MNSMLQHKQTKCATELGLLLVKLYSDTHTPVSPATLEVITHHFASYPEGVDDGKVDFMKAALRWTMAEGKKYGEAVLHDLLAEWFTQQKEYGYAQRHYIRGDSSDKFAVMLVNFAKLGHPSEADLFIARAVFQYLCLGKTKEAVFVLESFLSAFPALRITPTPLVNFLGFLLEALDQKSPQLFKMLREKYTPSIQRDPTFNQYLDQIGIQFFNIQPQAEGGIGGLLNNFMKAFFTADTETGEGN